MRQIFLILALILPGFAALATPPVLPHVLVHFAVRPEALNRTESGGVSMTPDSRDRHRRLARLAQDFGEHYLAAYRLLQPNVLQVVPLGSGMFNIVFETLAESERVLEAFPRGCAVLLEDSPFEVNVMRNELSVGAID